MIAVSSRWLALLVLALPFVAVLAAGPDEKEIARLVKQLGDDDFEKREEATARLKAIGEPVLDSLDQAKTSTDLELRRRAESIVDAIENHLCVEQRRLTGHKNTVWTASVSTDSKHVLTSSHDNTLRLWDADTGKCLRIFTGHTESVYGAVLSPDGKRVLSISTDKTLRLWDTDTGKELLNIHRDTNDNPRAIGALSLAFGPEGQALSCGCDRTVRLWDLRTGKQLRALYDYAGSVRMVAYSEKAKVAATACDNRSILLWSPDTGKVVRKLTGHEWTVTTICFSPDGKRLFSAYDDGTLSVWDVEMGEELNRSKVDSIFYGAAFSADGKRFVSAHDDKSVHVWETETSKEIRQYQGHTGYVTCVAIFPDGRRIISASVDDTARNLASAALTSSRKESNMTAVSSRWLALLVLALPFVAVLAADPDEKEIARLVKQLGDDDFEKREAATARLKALGEPALDALRGAAKSQDAEVRRRSADILDKIYGEHLCLNGHTGHVQSVAVSADGKHVLTGSADKTLRLWDADTGKCLRIFEGHTAVITGAALSPDGKLVLSGSDDCTVRVWDAETGKELHKLVGHTKAVECVAFGPEGQALSGGWDQAMNLWDLKTGKNMGVFAIYSSVESAPNYVLVVAYSDKAKLAVACTNDRWIYLWNLDTGKTVRRLGDHTKAVVAICFSPDGKRLLSGNFDDGLCLWDVETGKGLKHVNTPCRAVAFSPNGKRFLSGDADGAVHLWDAETGNELRQYTGHTLGVTSVAFFPDGKRVASASYDGTARIWRAPR